MKVRVLFRREWVLQGYVSLVALGGAAAVAYAMLHLSHADMRLLLVLLGLAAVAQFQALPLFGENSISMAYALAFIALLTIGPEAAILVNLLSGLIHAFHPKRRPFMKVAFNIGALTMTAWAGGVAYRLAGGSIPSSNLILDLPPAMAAGLAYFLLNSSSVSLAMSLSTGQSLLQIWVINHRWLILHYLAAAIISMTGATIFGSMGLPGLLIFLPSLALPWVAMRTYVGTTKEVQQRNLQLEKANRELQALNEDLTRRLQELGSSQPATLVPNAIALHQ